MARLDIAIQVAKEGLDACTASFASIAVAADCAHMDDLGLDMAKGIMTYEGMPLVEIGTRYAPGVVTAYIKPVPAMIFYVGWLMTQLPAHATVTWRDGWPHIHCPPRDDRDSEDGPAPRVPGQLAPA